MFGHKNNQDITQDVSSAPSVPPVDVYTMPEKFQSQQAYSSRAPLIIVLSVLVLVVLVSGSYFAYDYWLAQQAEIVRQQQVQQTAEISPIITEPPMVEPTVIATTSDTALVASTTASTTDVFASPVSTTVMPQFAADTDADGLTDIEEGIIGSGIANPDTDGDGYRDGSEVSNGYNPLIAGSDEAAKMSAAAFMTRVTTDFIDNNFSVAVPKAWRSQTVIATRQLIITTDSGEIIRITAKDNPQGLSAANWYLQSRPSAVLSELQTVNFGQLSGISSISGLDIYLRNLTTQQLYSFEYALATGSTTFNHPTLFNYLVKSFTLSVATTSSPMMTSSSTADVQ
jgi:hypothetical protein